MTDSKHIDVVVVGAGHNGLVSAAYLAKSGLQVLVLEASDKVGGAAATSEFSEGFSVSECAHFLYSLHPTIVKDLQLANHGLSYVATDLKTVALSSEGKHITMAGSEIQGEDVSTEDISNYRRFHTQMKRFSKVLASSFTHRPPRLVDGDMKDKLSLLKLGWNARKMGRQNMLELLRIGAINIYDVLNENFDNFLKARLAWKQFLDPIRARDPQILFWDFYTGALEKHTDFADRRFHLEAWAMYPMQSLHQPHHWGQQFALAARLRGY